MTTRTFTHLADLIANPCLAPLRVGMSISPTLENPNPLFAIHDRHGLTISVNEYFVALYTVERVNRLWWAELQARRMKG